MLVDDYEKYNNDRQDVVETNADESVEDAEGELMADDCTLLFYATLYLGNVRFTSVHQGRRSIN
jgi:hypothetical protein